MSDAVTPEQTTTSTTPTNDQTVANSTATTGVPNAPQQPSTENKPAEFVPLTDESFKLDLPEGVTLDPELKSGFMNLANDLKLPRETVDKLAELHTGALRRAVEQQAKQWDDLQQQWRKEVESSPKFGGDKLQPSLGKISEFINKFSSNPDGVRQAIDQTGLGNHPLMVELLLAAANTLSEGTPATGAPAAAPASLADSIYTTMRK